MGYCTLDDVNNLVPQQPFDANSVPSAPQVEALIDDIARDMNASIRNLGYQLPVDSQDSPESYALLGQANKWGALGLAQDVRMTAVQADTAVAGARNVWTQRYMDWKKALQDPKNPYELPDAVRTSSAVVKPVGSLLESGKEGCYATDAPFRIGMQV